MYNILAEYLSYYNLRSMRYEGHPHYQRVYKAECDLHEAFLNYTAENGNKDQFIELSFKSALALALDDASYKYKVYNELNEETKATREKELINSLEKVTNLNELVEVSNRIDLAYLQIITEEEQTLSAFIHVANKLLLIEQYKTADAINSYQKELEQIAFQVESEIKRDLDVYKKDLLYKNPNFKWEWEILNKKHLRRKIPFSDTLFQRLLSKIEPFS